MRRIIFGIRKSALAKSQFEEFIAYLTANKIIFYYDVRTIATEGDKDQKTPVAQLGSGIFTKSIELALLSKEIDCAVHSLKDMPVKIEKGTIISCFLPRQDPRDSLLVRDDVVAENLRGLRVGTGSPRRSAFLQETEPDIKIIPIRGNVDTRIRKLDQGHYDAIVLATCGLKRLGYENRINRYFDPENFVPAAGQGVVCSQTRATDEELNTLLNQCSSVQTQQTSLAERMVLAALNVGCQKPFGVYARFVDETFVITAKYYVETTKEFISKRCTSRKSDWEQATANIIDALKLKIGKL